MKPAVKPTYNFRLQAEPEGGYRVTENGGVELVQIPAGTFLMGSPKSEKGRDRREGRQQWERDVGRFASDRLRAGRDVGPDRFGQHVHRERGKPRRSAGCRRVLGFGHRRQVLDGCTHRVRIPA